MSSSTPPNERLVRIDERTLAIQEDVAELKGELQRRRDAEVDFATKVELAAAMTALQAVVEKSSGTFATKDELKPVRMIAYGLVSLVLTGVGLALLGLVIKGRP